MAGATSPRGRLPDKHLPEEVLLDYAAGGLPEALALLVASHLALCPACRGVVADCEAIGGALLAAVDPVPLVPGALDRALARIDAAECAPRPAGPAPVARRDSLLPRPLGDYVGGVLSALAWRRLLPGIEAVALPIAADGRGDAFRASLMRFGPGVAAPRHTHLGCEATLVLQGGFTDRGQHFERGDVSFVDASVDHRPVAAPDDGCLCLICQDAPLKLTGPIGRWFNRFLRG